MSNSADPFFWQYTDMLAKAAFRFQFLEQILKMYISSCYEIIALQLKGRLPFDYSYKDVADVPLGRLIRQFKKLNTNTTLVSELERLVKERNYIAHSGYLMTVEEVNDSIHLAKELARVEAIASRANLAVLALTQETTVVETLKRELSK